MRGRIFILTILFVFVVSGVRADNRSYTLQTMKRVFSYAASVDTIEHSPKEGYAYTKYAIRTNRRNAVLLTVPSMFAIANASRREVFGETYNHMRIDAEGTVLATRLLESSTTTRKSQPMPTVLNYLTPLISEEMLIDGRIISPFFQRNRRYYRYKAQSFTQGTALVNFTPRQSSTQLVSGWAQVDELTGRIIEFALDGEYDMVRFHLSTTMDEEEGHTLLPKECTLNARFLFLGNDITAEYTTIYGLPDCGIDSLAERDDTTLLARVRPIPLTEHEAYLCQQSYNDNILNDSTSKTHGSIFNRQLLTNVGETLMGRIGGDIGRDKRGTFNIGPILNPLQFSYSNRRGLTYLLDVQAQYNFTANQKMQARIKAGYAFKQKQFYFTIPITYYFSNRHNGYVQTEWTSGRRIRNSSVLDAIKDKHDDAMNWDSLNLTYFRDHSLKAYVHYDPTPRWGLEVGVIGHRRTAIQDTGFEDVGMPTTYISVAPMVELTYRPIGYAGPILTANYERSINGFMGANIDYERIELNAQYIHRLSALNSLQMRLGTGFYTHSGTGRYFLDYRNFRENNIPNGWNDNWSGSFELLNSNWYNASQYYVRSNVTYETPQLALYWLPYIGRLLEKERVYVSALSVSHLTPYLEWGYGVQTRALSIGVFASQKKWKFTDIAVRFSLELFNRW